ncbi:hypothetical protein LCGC14_0844110 [marine sediment metagenome]|uniref:Uncharacterized protein n=1 Tax=marine sediment metagenome TaxID=412755 RepID=A0A0F9RWY7_9ZZZZ
MMNFGTTESIKKSSGLWSELDWVLVDDIKKEILTIINGRLKSKPEYTIEQLDRLYSELNSRLPPKER